MFERLRDRLQRRNGQRSKATPATAGIAYYDLRPRSSLVPDLGYTIVPVHAGSLGTAFDDILADIATLRWSGLVQYHRPEVSLTAYYTWAFEQGRMLWKKDHDGKELPRESMSRV